MLAPITGLVNLLAARFKREPTCVDELDQGELMGLLQSNCEFSRNCFVPSISITGAASDRFFDADVLEPPEVLKVVKDSLDWYRVGAKREIYTRTGRNQERLDITFTPRIAPEASFTVALSYDVMFPGEKTVIIPALKL